jgi:hypothetical protein
MTPAPAISEARVDVLDAFIERARARAYLYSIGELTLHEAVDELQQSAEQTGLVNRIGQDAVQGILATAIEDYLPAGKAAENADPDPPTPNDENALVVFPLQAFENIRLEAERRNYLVKGLLAITGLAVIWGPPKCGKSFWAADLGLHIALGRDYRGHKVQQAPVVYVALEPASKPFDGTTESKLHRSIYLQPRSTWLPSRRNSLPPSSLSSEELFRAHFSWTLSTEALSAPRAKTRTWRAFWPRLKKWLRS